MEHITVENFLTFTIGIIVFFIGVHTNRRVSLLRQYNIPEPVTGGLIAALVTSLIYWGGDIAITFELEVRDQLLVYFFTAIGINARIRDLLTGGKPLLILLALTLGYIVLQNIVGIAGASMLGLPTAFGVLAGSSSLIGGHGTAIAWAPDIAQHGIPNALEIGVACATMGLIVASLIGGPIAQVLIKNFQLKGKHGEGRVIGVSHKTEELGNINHLSFMAAMLILHIAILLGYFINHALESYGFKLPLFVSCLICGIILSNTVPLLFPRLSWPARTPALAIISDFSLGLFLAMSLMSMQLWTLAGLAGPLLIILGLQTLAAITFIRWVLFPLMGKDYQAAVLSAGFGGFALGATPTAIANMTAVTKAHGPAPLAFIILPLVAAFFVDITNAVVIRYALMF